MRIVKIYTAAGEEILDSKGDPKVAFKLFRRGFGLLEVMTQDKLGVSSVAKALCDQDDHEGAFQLLPLVILFVVFVVLGFDVHCQRFIFLWNGKQPLQDAALAKIDRSVGADRHSNPYLHAFISGGFNPSQDAVVVQISHVDKVI